MAQTAPDIHLVDRRTGATVRETVLGDRLLRLACLPPVRGLARGLLFNSGLPTRLLGWYADSRWSRGKIAATIRELALDMADYETPPGGYANFNDFFTRRLKPGRRPVDPNPAVVASPADCRLLVYERLSQATCFPVKGVSFTLPELLGPGPDAAAEAARLVNGVLLVCRLCPADYHRFHYPAAGRTAAAWAVPGAYESVNPFALAAGARPFSGNARQVSILDTAAAGRLAFIEVGAFGVGRIVQTHTAESFAKMDEKGFFAFGGSTLVLVFPHGMFQPDADLCRNSAQGLETLIRAGETLGRGGAAAP